MNTIFQSESRNRTEQTPLELKPFKKESCDYPSHIRKISCIEAVCSVSGLKLSEIKRNDDAKKVISYKRIIRNVLVDMLYNCANLKYRNIAPIIGLRIKQISNIANKNKSAMEESIRKECFEKYCQLMLQRVKVCKFPKSKTVSVYVNYERNDFRLRDLHIV